MRPTNYLIAFTVRSGSTLLCDYLSANGLGQPMEYFQHPFGVANRWAYDLTGAQPDDFAGYLRGLPVTCGRHGIFGAKIAWDHKNVLLDECRRHGLPAADVADLFPGVRWLHLKRRNRAAQAVSAWRAVASGRWHSVDPDSARPAPAYDYFGVFRFFFSILVEEQLWEHYFGRGGVVPLTLYYEDLVDDPQRVLAQAASHILGAASPPGGVGAFSLETRLIPLRDAYSAGLESRFLDDLYRIGVPAHWETRQEEVGRWMDFFQNHRWRSGGDPARG